MERNFRLSQDFLKNRILANDAKGLDLLNERSQNEFALKDCKTSLSIAIIKEAEHKKLYVESQRYKDSKSKQRGVAQMLLLKSEGQLRQHVVQGKREMNDCSSFLEWVLIIISLGYHGYDRCKVLEGT